MPDVERQVGQEQAARLVRADRPDKHRNGITSQEAPKRRDRDRTLLVIIAAGVLVVGGFIALIVVRGIQRLG